MKTITTHQEAMEAIAECEKVINEQMALIKEIAQKFNMTVNFDFKENKPEDDDSWSNSWQSSSC